MSLLNRPTPLLDPVFNHSRFKRITFLFRNNTKVYWLISLSYQRSCTHTMCNIYHGLLTFRRKCNNDNTLCDWRVTGGARRLTRHCERGQLFTELHYLINILSPFPSPTNSNSRSHHSSVRPSQKKSNCRAVGRGGGVAFLDFWKWASWKRETRPVTNTSSLQSSVKLSRSLDYK